ncbi:tigger transposable element-derived protein 6-like [Haliotis rubra]|uniref:tigger transposable element-derived protein 6-like n=1 Tax=Haliotis rubra TaxID=36100 RepID=UPI001EE547E4|nr:tigger transposable element-derived protein 6-like [Haliotis rubra]
MIGKYRRPRCFGKDFNPEIYARYRFNKKAWMTSEMFSDWLRTFDRQCRSRGRCVILLVDNAASHNCKHVKLTNVKVHFLPPNTTSRIQPLDAGIIRTFKAYYKRSLVRHFIACAEDDKPQCINLREALRFVKSAWADVSCQTIKNCFKHVEILPSQESQIGETDDLEDDIVLADLKKLLQRLPSDDENMSPDDFIDADANEETCDSLTSENIIEMVTAADDQIESEEEEAEDTVTLPSLTDMRLYLGNIVTCYECQGDIILFPQR